MRSSGRIVALVLVLGAAGCGKDNGVLPPGSAPIASPDFCANFYLAVCDQSTRCGRDSTTPCLTLAARTLDECPLMAEAVVRDEADYDEVAAGAFVDDVRALACDASLPDPVARGVFTPLKDTGLVCHSKASCKPGLTCQGHTVSTPEGTCVTTAG